MSVPKPVYAFRKEAARAFLSGQRASVLLTGNVTDLFFLEPEWFEGDDDHAAGNYVSLLDYLRTSWSQDSRIVPLAYEVNGPIEIVNAERDEPLLKEAWLTARAHEIRADINAQAAVSGSKVKAIDLDEARARAEKQWVDFQLFVNGDATKALKLMRKLCKISRESKEGDPLWGKRIVILLEDANLVIPEAEVSRLSPDDRARAILCRNWFSDTDFQRGSDAVILIAESASQVNSQVSKLPQMSPVIDVPGPDLDARRHFIKWFNATQPDDKKIQLWGSQRQLAQQAAGLSLHALWSLLKGSIYDGQSLQPDAVDEYVEAYILSQLGEGTVEFHTPHHRVGDLVGNSKVVELLMGEFIPDFMIADQDTPPGLVVSGPIGAGKTYIFEAFAAELGMPVLILKNLRSKWFGETDVIMERLYRVLGSLSKVAIFVDEADTVFGGVGKDQHATERRLTGKIQSWMSDPRLKGRVIWILMTARVENLSPDIRRPGRVGDIIIPILDPEGEDRDAFIRWMLEPSVNQIPEKGSEEWMAIEASTRSYAAANFATLRSKLKRVVRRKQGIKLAIDYAIRLIRRQLTADIGDARRMQTLFAKANTTIIDLLPELEGKGPEEIEKIRSGWSREAHQLKAILA